MESHFLLLGREKKDCVALFLFSGVHTAYCTDNGLKDQNKRYKCRRPSKSRKEGKQATSLMENLTTKWISVYYIRDLGCKEFSFGHEQRSRNQFVQKISHYLVRVIFVESSDFLMVLPVVLYTYQYGYIPKPVYVITLVIGIACFKYYPD